MRKKKKGALEYLVSGCLKKVSKNGFLTFASSMLYLTKGDGHMRTTFKDEILEIFGTTDLEQLKRFQKMRHLIIRKNREMLPEGRILLQRSR